MVMQTAAGATPGAATRWARVVLAGPLVLICSILIMGGSLVWVPAGAGGVNHIVLPIVLYPAIWTALFFYACFDRRLWRGYAVVGGLLVLHAILIVMHRAGVTP